MKWVLVLMLGCAPARSAAQLLAGQHLLFRDAGAGPQLRLHYQNDAFAHTDYYHSQHVSATVLLPALQRNPLNLLFLQPSGEAHRYGLSVSHDAWTPTSILSDSILYGDRPFAATLVLESFLTVVSARRHDRITSSLTLGVIGPAAGGYQVQKGIHERTRNDIPHGWQYQIANAPVVNYGLGYEKQLLRAGSWLLLSGRAQADAGTLRTAAGAGPVLMLGYGAHPFAPEEAQAFAGYLYGSFLASLVGYDATMQGGVFGGSPYTIAAGEVRRGLAQGRVGAVIRYRSLYLEAYFDRMGREFRGGRPHEVVGFLLGFGW